MNNLQLPEEKIAVKAKVQIFKIEKKYLFLRDDKVLAQIQYFPLPYKSSETKTRMNQKFTLKDEKGLEVELSVTFAPASKK